MSGETGARPGCGSDAERWAVLCDILELSRPAEPYPAGTPTEWRLFRDDRDHTTISRRKAGCLKSPSDNSAWAMTPLPGWPAAPDPETITLNEIDTFADCPLGRDPVDLRILEETFPGNLASFDRHGVAREREAVTLTLRSAQESTLARPYRSGALVSSFDPHHGRFEADIRAACGAGLVTGFFLHRTNPRQEIDFEITGDDPTSVLLNVYFNPGDAGTGSVFGYRGSSCRIPLGIDASAEFHRYSIDWRPDRIMWAVDGRVIHQRGSWDPTPIPHLPMKLHFNLWAPRSHELAGAMKPTSLPAEAAIKNIRISG